ncbi:MAG: FtsX-like permease family protein [Candidatus Kapaibacterium sp.]|nr:MAG: FtsX-like permease family protein [Candidatus Kapabacteria bacterium]
MISASSRVIIVFKKLVEHNHKSTLSHPFFKIIMLQNYLKIALRSLLRQKSYSAINIIGLAVGMACCLVMLLFVQDELSYDRVYSNAASIYRVTPRFYRGLDTAKGNTANANAQIPLAPAMMRDLSGIKQAVRMFKYKKMVVRNGDKMFAEERVFAVDKNYPKMFATTFLAGSPATALVEPYSVVLTESLARKYFGTSTPLEQLLGKTILLENTEPHRVSGIITDAPHNIHLRYDALVSFASIEKWIRDQGADPNNLWGLFLDASTYVELQDGVNASVIEAQMPKFLTRYMAGFMKELKVNVHYPLQPLTDIHLNPTPSEFQPQSSRTTVSVFAGVAVFILAIACMNFMNLATARSQRRAREVGVRKALGAQRNQLIMQFLTEAVVISCIALVLALVLVELALPSFNSIVRKELSVGYASNPALILGLLFAALLTGIAAGSYPAFALSGFTPVRVLAGRLTTSRSGALVRKSLVALQFTISILMMIATIVVAMQLHYTRSKDLGLRTEQVIRLALPGDSTSISRYAALQQSLRSVAGVSSVSGTSYSPGASPSQSGITLIGAAEKNTVISAEISTDAAFVPTMQMNMLQGRNFSQNNVNDKTASCLLNEAAVNALGLGKENPIGKQVNFGGNNGRNLTVIGVVKNFHYESMHRSIRPAIVMIAPSEANFESFLLKVQAQNIPELLQNIEQTWRKHLPERMLDYSFLDENFAKLYQAEQAMASLISVFAGLAIFIASLGVFGLVAFAVEVRRKELGIRKVLGASAASIIALLSKDFLVLVGIAIVLATPLAYWAAGKWLQGFVYRMELTWWMFASAGVAAVVIAFITVAAQAWRAAAANPVQSLRSE